MDDGIASPPTWATNASACSWTSRGLLVVLAEFEKGRHFRVSLHDAQQFLDIGACLKIWRSNVQLFNLRRTVSDRDKKQGSIGQVEVLVVNYNLPGLSIRGCT